MDYHAIGRRFYVGVFSIAFLAIGSLGYTQEQAAVIEEAAPAIEEVVVYGIRKSLESALAEKREKANLTEIINADDIGKLPDENVAEVLENIPGVQITRSGGIGEGVSIRGSNENRVEINGRGTVSDGDDRGGIRFSDLPAALVRSLNVVKVPTADMVEGSIGGTINVKTYRGLKLKKPLKVVRFTSEYAQNSEAWNENAAITWGDIFYTDFGDIGAILTLSHIKKTVREDALRVSPSTRVGTAGNNFPSQLVQFPPVGEEAFTPYYYPGFSDTIYGEEDRENNSLSGSLEWQASNKLKLFFEGTYNDIERLERRQTAFMAFGTAVNSIGDFGSNRELDGLREATFGFTNVGGVQIPIYTSGIIAGGIRQSSPVIDGASASGLSDGLQIRTSNRTNGRDTESFVAALGGEWEDESLLVEFEINAAESDSNTTSFITSFQYNDPTDPAAFHTLSARVRVPFLFEARDGNLAYGPVPGIAQAENLLNPDYYSLYVARDTFTQFDNESYAQKVDFTWDLDQPFWNEFRFGLRASQRSTERIRESLTTDIFPFGASDPLNLASPALFPEVDLSGFLTATPGNFLEFNRDGVYLDNFLTPDYRQVDELRRVLQTSAGLGVDNRLAPPQGFRVEEDTYAAYLRGDFYADIFGMPLRGNVGLRVIQTYQLSSGNELNDQNQFEFTSVRQRYTNSLPSASLVLQPQEKVQLRLGYAKILRRPSFAQVAPTFEFPLNEGQAVREGDPNLQPTTAEQIDFAVEYYFRKGSVFSVGYFYKDIEDTIGTESETDAICNPIAISDSALNCGDDGSGGFAGVLVDTIKWVNLPGGKIEGFEVALQHNFNWLPRPYNGFGIIANYAYQDGERDTPVPTSAFLTNAGVAVDGLTLNFRGLSEESYNFTLYFERPRYRLSGRIRYTYRDGFLLEESSDVSNTLPLYRDDRGQLNASMSYRLDDTFTLTLSGVNITKEQGTERAAFLTGPLVRQRDADRRIALGIRGRF